MARRLLPAAIIVPLLAGSLTLHFERHGTFSFEAAVALFALSSAVVSSWPSCCINAARGERADPASRLPNVRCVSPRSATSSSSKPRSTAWSRSTHKGIITGWNSQAEKLFGWPRAEALGRELAELIIPERLREQHRSGMRRYVETGVARC